MKALFKDKRSGSIAVVAHCVLNQNSRVPGLAERPCVIEEIVQLLVRNSIGLIQMPCPELSYAGLLRRRLAKDQYDTPMFRGLCKKVAEETADQIQEYAKCGIKTEIVVGVDGSPSCSVGEISKRSLGEDQQRQERVEDVGILMEELRIALREREISIPFAGIGHRHLSVDLANITRCLEG